MGGLRERELERSIRAYRAMFVFLRIASSKGEIRSRARARACRSCPHPPPYVVRSELLLNGGISARCEMTIVRSAVQRGRMAVGTTLFFSRANSEPIMAIRLAEGNRMI